MNLSSAGHTRTEQDLVKAILRNDRDAFRELVKRYEKLVVQIVCRMIRRVPDQEDLCQEVFLKVYDNLENYRFESKLSTWIGRIAFNTCVSFLQKKQVVWLEKTGSDEESELEIYGTGDHKKQPDELLVQKEQHKLLWKLVDELPPVQQTIVSLFHQEGLTMDEIATMLNMPMGTIKSYLHRARQALRKKLLSQ